jgi:hypothetical protein
VREHHPVSVRDTLWSTPRQLYQVVTAMCTWAGLGVKLRQQLTGRTDCSRGQPADVAGVPGLFRMPALAGVPSIVN